MRTARTTVLVRMPTALAESLDVWFDSNSRGGLPDCIMRSRNAYICYLLELALKQPAACPKKRGRPRKSP